MLILLRLAHFGRDKFISPLSIMGNFIATIASIGIPLFTKTVAIPYIFHPLRWGGIPWSEPHWLIVAVVTLLLNIISLMGVGTLSGMMTTKKACNKTDTWLSFKRSTWLVIGYIIGNFIVFMTPIIKAPILPFTLWLPYAGWLVHGFLVAFAVMFFGAMGNTMLRAEVCR